MAETKFEKSRSNRGTENAGRDLLLTDPRMQWLDAPTRRHVLAGLGVSGDFGIQSFDGVMTELPAAPLTISTVDLHLPTLRLVEMKTTTKPIRNSALNGFFFGATAREYALAEILGDRYVFAFVVLNSDNEYDSPFAVLLPLSEVKRRTKNERIQYQVNFKGDTIASPDDGTEIVVLDPSRLTGPEGESSAAPS